jgi:hypothetical protein
MCFNNVFDHAFIGGEALILTEFAQLHFEKKNEMCYFCGSMLLHILAKDKIMNLVPPPAHEPITGLLI